MIRTFCFLVFTFLLVLPISEASAQFWYSSTGKQPLTIDSTKINIKLLNGDSGINDIILLTSLEAIHAVLDDRSVYDGFVACTLLREYDYADVRTW